MNMKNVNKTTYIRAPKDPNHPYMKLSNAVCGNYNLDYCEKAIMMELLAHPDVWVVNKGKVRELLKMPFAKFNKAWKGLEDKHFILSERFFGGMKWVINESGNYSFDKKDKPLDNNTHNTEIKNISNHLFITDRKQITELKTLDLSTKEGNPEGETPRPRLSFEVSNEKNYDDFDLDFNDILNEDLD